MSDLVSVIITTYKRPNFLKRAVDSVLSQTYPNIEIVVVDDNNPESEYRNDTEKLMNEHYGNVPNVHYVKLPQNSGSCKARNLGVSYCKGKYINFLDDDDAFLPTKIEKQVSLFENDKDGKLAVVGCFANILNSHDEIIGMEEVRFRGDAFFHEMCSNLTTTALALIRKDIYLKSGGFEQMYSSQEHWMFMKIYSVLPGYDYIGEPLVNIYHHDGERISTNKNKPLGAIQLFENAKKLLSRFDKREQRIIQQSINSIIIISFLKINDRKNAFKYFILRYKFSNILNANDIKLLIMCILGWSAYSKLSNIKR